MSHLENFLLDAQANQHLGVCSWTVVKKDTPRKYLGQACHAELFHERTLKGQADGEIIFDLRHTTAAKEESPLNEEWFRFLFEPLGSPYRDILPSVYPHTREGRLVAYSLIPGAPRDLSCSMAVASRFPFEWPGQFRTWLAVSNYLGDPLKGYIASQYFKANRDGTHSPAVAVGSGHAIGQAGFETRWFRKSPNYQKDDTFFFPIIRDNLWGVQGQAIWRGPGGNLGDYLDRNKEKLGGYQVISPVFKQIIQGGIPTKVVSELTQEFLKEVV